MDAWIEIFVTCRENVTCLVASFMDAWIEIQLQTKMSNAETSHPLWMRGLKWWCFLVFKPKDASHPLWMRGLKYVIQDEREFEVLVASFMDAWIEIIISSLHLTAPYSRILYGCVD